MNYSINGWNEADEFSKQMLALMYANFFDKIFYGNKSSISVEIITEKQKKFLNSIFYAVKKNHTKE